MEKIKIKNPVIILLVFPIRIYQIFISPYIAPSCRFYPSCSQYCLESLQKFGFFKGIYYSLMRLKECHPFGKSGFDPVKENLKFREISLFLIKKYRKENLYFNLSKNLADYKEDKYKETKHFAIYKDERVVSGLTLIKDISDFQNKSFQIRGMFTTKYEKEKGYGSMLIEKIIIKLRKDKIKFLWCNSRILAIEFYKKNKFKETGKEFHIKLLGKHKKLTRKI